ncbi:hypothetical protein TcasGA2_TC034314 [Tribolium castaneum]|uniref:Uncharacterized protein n=1 Tax=Tribolium castaneum TaxID=7070 RepID=A0A139WC80_TRICA|nr:hypothetical protein TcasGA2_TC034314 [Tribolium castaneum]
MKADRSEINNCDHLSVNSTIKCLLQCIYGYKIHEL